MSTLKLEAAPRPDDEDEWERRMVTQRGGLCSCGPGDPCPLYPDAKGAAPRCRANDLRDALLCANS